VSLYPNWTKEILRLKPSARRKFYRPDDWCFLKRRRNHLIKWISRWSILPSCYKIGSGEFPNKTLCPLKLAIWWLFLSPNRKWTKAGGREETGSRDAGMPCRSSLMLLLVFPNTHTNAFQWTFDWWQKQDVVIKFKAKTSYSFRFGLVMWVANKNRRQVLKIICGRSNRIAS